MINSPLGLPATQKFETQQPMMAIETVDSTRMLAFGEHVVGVAVTESSVFRMLPDVEISDARWEQINNARILEGLDPYVRPNQTPAAYGDGTYL